MGHSDFKYLKEQEYKVKKEDSEKSFSEHVFEIEDELCKRAEMGDFFRIFIKFTYGKKGFTNKQKINGISVNSMMVSGELCTDEEIETMNTAIKAKETALEDIEL